MILITDKLWIANKGEEIAGVEFESCFENKTEIEVKSITINSISIDDLIKAKKTAGRFQDLADAENLE